MQADKAKKKENMGCRHVQGSEGEWQPDMAIGIHPPMAGRGSTEKGLKNPDPWQP